MQLEYTTIRNKRKIQQTEQEHNQDITDKTNTQKKQTPETPPKKPYTAHGMHRTTKQLRMDYVNATNLKDAYQQWKKIIQRIRDIDSTMIIHSRDNNHQITKKDVLPEQNQVHKYAEINTIKKSRKMKKPTQA